MTDDKLNRLLEDAARTFRVPPEPPLDAMWAAIEAEAFDTRVQHRGKSGLTLSWHHLGVGLAAALVLGVGIGRFSAVSRLTADREMAVLPGSSTYPDSSWTTVQPYVDATSAYLGQTAALLASLPAEAGRERSNNQFSQQATDLLSTTRLLLDSPPARDPQLRALLEDLELVLSQIAQLPARRDAARLELELIADALEQRDVVPRLRSAVVDIANSDN